MKRFLFALLLTSSCAHAQVRPQAIVAGTVRPVEVFVDPARLKPDCQLTVVTQPGLKMLRTTFTHLSAPRSLPSNQGDGVMLVLHCEYASAVKTLTLTQPTSIGFGSYAAAWDSFLGYRPTLEIR